MRGGFLGALEGCFAEDFGATARREWGVLPQNSGVFEWREGVVRRFGARRTWAGARGKKNFLKKIKKRGGKPKNGGARGVGRLHESIPYRVCGVIFGSGSQASGSTARGALRVGASTTGTHRRSQRFTPLIYRVCL